MNADMGQVPIILLLHGFPELWYSWRHQILYLAAHGYRAVAPDPRGYGDTTGAPVDDPTKFTTLHVVGDMVTRIAALSVDKVLGQFEHSLCPKKPSPENCRDSSCCIDRLSLHLPISGNISAEPGEIEAVFASLGTKKVFEKFLTHRDPDPFYFPRDSPFGALCETPIILPSWLSEEDVDYYTKKFEQTGFT
uniref:AB hydrolase-1 domain-containing protein n=1 Tax=Lactuca sativa TaxID=4236 RepID=A0A9R1WWA7_LACSA|nr:hypothetical protein LSAT_V11C900460970 [Lactuca sativa]